MTPSPEVFRSQVLAVSMTLASLGLLNLSGVGDRKQALTEACAVNSGSPDADQILDRYILALGGRHALERVKSWVIRGTIDLGPTRPNAKIEVYAKAPNKKLSVIEIPGFGVMREGYDGKVGWEQTPRVRLRQKTGTELVQLRRASEFYGVIRLKELFPHIMVKGKHSKP